MSKYLRPCVALGPWHPDNGGYYGPNSITRARNIEFYANSRTKWARFWVSWQYLQPRESIHDPVAYDSDPNIYENVTRDDGSAYNEPTWMAMKTQQYVLQLDDQIIQARRAGLNVILTLYQCPRWANRARRKNGDGSWKQDLHDVNADGNRAHWYVPPEDRFFKDGSGQLSVDSRVGEILRFLFLRYSIYNGAAAPRNVDWIEVCNEPNHQWRPADEQFQQQAAWFMKLGWKIAKDHAGGSPLAFGPALADHRTSAGHWSLYWNFMQAMFTHLRNGELIYDLGGRPARAFDESDGLIGWSHHNYVDVEFERYGEQTSVSTEPSQGFNGVNGAQATRFYLKNRTSNPWRGWANPTDPHLAITEGGARIWKQNDARLPISEYPVQDVNAQRDRVTRIWYRHYNGHPVDQQCTTQADGPLAHNIAMVSNYLFWSNNEYFDVQHTDFRGSGSGMCKPIDYSVPGGLPPEDRWLPGTPVDRPLFANWAGFRSQAPRDVKSFWGYSSLGGWCEYSPEIVALSPGMLEVFVVGGDRAIWHRWWSAGAGWSGWYSLTGDANSSIGAACRNSSTIDIFARSGSNIWRGYRTPSGAWEVYYYMGAPPGGATSGPDASSVKHDNHMEVFVAGADGSLWHRWAFNDNWSNWESLGGSMWSDPTAIAWGNPDRVYAFHKTWRDANDDDQIRWVGYDAGVGWRELGMIRGPRVRPQRDPAVREPRRFNGAPEVCSMGRDHMEMFVLGSDNCYWRLTYANGAWEEEWEWMGGPQGNGQNYQMTSEPAACSWGPDRIDLVGVGANRELWWSGFAPGGQLNPQC